MKDSEYIKWLEFQCNKVYKGIDLAKNPAFLNKSDDPKPEELVNFTLSLKGQLVGYYQ